MKCDSDKYSLFMENKNNANYYKVVIDKIEYLFIVITNNYFKINGTLKANTDFDLLDTFKCKLLFIKTKDFTHNYIDNNNKDFHFNIQKDNIILFDIKSTFIISILTPQIKFHDNQLFNLFSSCGENLNNYFYFCILTDKNKTNKKINELKRNLNDNQIKINITSFQTENFIICGNNYNTVIDKEYLAKTIMNKIEDLSNNINEIKGKQSIMEETQKTIQDGKSSMQRSINNIKNNMVTNEFMFAFVNEMRNNFTEIRNNLANKGGFFSSIRRLLN